MAAQRTYLAIDLKSFYASVECVDRHLDPLTTNLVVADVSRTEKTICLVLTYPGGCKAESIQTIGQELERNARIVGTKGSIFLPDFQHAETMTLVVEGKAPEAIRCPVDINDFEYEIREASRCVKLGHEVYGRGVSTHLAAGLFRRRKPWYTENDNPEFEEIES